MNLQGYPLLLVCIFLSTIVATTATEKYAQLDSSQDDKHENQPRLLGGFFSRPKPQAEKQHGLKDHLGNILNGGTIGFQAEFQPLAPIHGIIDHAKNLLPKPPMIIDFHKPSPTFVKPPNGQGPNPWWQGGGDKEYDEREYPDEKHDEYVEADSGEISKPDEYAEAYPEEEPKPNEYDEAYPEEKPKPDEYENPKEWDAKEPKVGEPDGGPKWEDIGEESHGDAEGSTTVPIEHIINPRIRRTKRRAESKVFHVPLEFLSNAKPYLVKLGMANHV